MESPPDPPLKVVVAVTGPVEVWVPLAVVMGPLLETMAELATQRGITRARMTQIMDLLLLAPDIQEALLFMPRTVRGCDQVTLRTMGYVCATLVWKDQRARWQEIKDA